MKIGTGVHWLLGLGGRFTADAKDNREEKRAVEQKAAEVAGEGNVTSEITIKAARAKKGTT